MMNSYLLIFFMPLACVDLNPDYIDPIESLQDDSCVNALSEYMECEWASQCDVEVRKEFPESWEAAQITYRMCYFGSPRCEDLEEGCEAL